MPIDVLTGLAGVANIGSFFKDLWDLHKDFPKKDALMLDRLLVQTGDDIGVANDFIAPYIMDIDPTTLKVLMDHLKK